MSVPARVIVSFCGGNSVMHAPVVVRLHVHVHACVIMFAAHTHVWYPDCERRQLRYLVPPGSLKAPCTQSTGKNRTVVDNLMKNVGEQQPYLSGPVRVCVCVCVCAPLQPFDVVH